MSATAEIDPTILERYPIGNTLGGAFIIGKSDRRDHSESRRAYLEEKASRLRFVAEYPHLYIVAYENVRDRLYVYTRRHIESPHPHQGLPCDGTSMGSLKASAVDAHVILAAYNREAEKSAAEGYFMCSACLHAVSKEQYAGRDFAASFCRACVDVSEKLQDQLQRSGAHGYYE